MLTFPMLVECDESAHAAHMTLTRGSCGAATRGQVAFSLHKPVTSVTNSGTSSGLSCVGRRYESFRLDDIRDREYEEHFIGLLQASPEMLEHESRVAMSIRVGIENRVPLGEIVDPVSTDHANHVLLLSEGGVPGPFGLPRGIARAWGKFDKKRNCQCIERGNLRDGVRCVHELPLVAPIESVDHWSTSSVTLS